MLGHSGRFGGCQGLQGLRQFFLANISSGQGLRLQVGSRVHALPKPGAFPADTCHGVAGGRAAKGDSVQGSETGLDGPDCGS